MEAALKAAKIRYYDTPRSDFGADQAALWTKTEAEATEAVRVLETAQTLWQARSREKGANSIRQRKRAWQVWVVVGIVAMALILSFLNPGDR
ncbi:MAG: hypothetical protein IPG43_02245 [Proteobacteria bacterium]|nr:hypothetical protein [Pseudomonadota bacterium]